MVCLGGGGVEGAPKCGLAGSGSRLVMVAARDGHTATVRRQREREESLYSCGAIQQAVAVAADMQQLQI